MLSVTVVHPVTVDMCPSTVSVDRLIHCKLLSAHVVTVIVQTSMILQVLMAIWTNIKMIQCPIWILKNTWYSSCAASIAPIEVALKDCALL